MPSVHFSFSGFPPKETKVFSGNLDLLYRKNKFQFSNKLTINHTSSGDPVVAFSEYAKANPYYEKKPDGRVEKWLEYKEELIESPNPLWNANLRCCQTNAASIFQGFLHIVQQTAQGFVKLCYRFTHGT